MLLETAATVSAWLRAWIAERADFASFLVVDLDVPPRDGDLVSVVAYPHTDARDARQSFLKPEHLAFTAVPMTLIRETLAPDTTARLRSALAIVAKLQGLDEREALVFILQLWLPAIDLARARKGQRSILLGLPIRASHTRDNPRVREAVADLLARPQLSLAGMLDFWARSGGPLADGFIRSPDGTLGRASYLVCPPAWIDAQDLATLKEAGGASGKIPILVDPAHAATTEIFARSAVALGKSGLPVSVSIGNRPPTEMPPADRSAAVFRREGAVWTVVYQGNTGRFKDARGFRYLHYLLRACLRSEAGVG